MILNFLTKVFGSKQERELKRLAPIVEQINALEPEVQAMSDQELQAQTPRFKERIDNGEPLDDLLPEAFATVREASWRTLEMRHFDVQMIGGIVLHQGKIAEMKTGEGKTLVATLPAYLNALSGNGVHVVTVNDYLARRDTEWMGNIYQFLGLSVGTILHGLDESGTSGRCTRPPWCAGVQSLPSPKLKVCPTRAKLSVGVPPSGGKSRLKTGLRRTHPTMRTLLFRQSPTFCGPPIPLPSNLLVAKSESADLTGACATSPR